MSYKSIHNLRWLWLSAFVVLVDQVSKYWVSHHFNFYQTLAVTPFFNLTLAHNRGAAFGMLNQANGWQLWFFSAIAVVVGIGILVWLCRLPKHETLSKVALALILGGAIGNLIDRIHLGYVIDYLDFYYQHWHFATFNVADTAVCIGAGLLMLQVLSKKD